MKNQDSLSHSAKGTTWSKGNHKYIWKEQKKGKWYYFYKADPNKPGYDGVSNMGYLDAIEDAYNNYNDRLEDAQYNYDNAKSASRKATYKRELSEAKKGLVKVSKDRRAYLEEHPYHSAKNEFTNFITKGKKFLKSIPKKYEASQKEWSKYNKSKKGS